MARLNRSEDLKSASAHAGEEHARGSVDRREFIRATAGLMVSAGAIGRGHAAAGEPATDEPGAGGPIADEAITDEVVAVEPQPFIRLPKPDWIRGVTSMAFGSQADLDEMAAAGVQVLHTNMVWPYYPLRRDGGGLAQQEATALSELVTACHRRDIRLSLGLPPFPPVALVRAHPDWRVHDDPAGRILDTPPVDDNLATRIGCNLSPWGDYLIEVCAELVEDFGIDGFSFDGNYHPPICYCPACRAAYQSRHGGALPEAVNLDDVEYRRYLDWRGQQLEAHYRQMQVRLRAANPQTAIMTWTVNAGRYGHLLHSPRAMPARLNLLFDLPMQEWWLDETNFGASVAPAFGAAYLQAVTGGGPAASEPYLMSRGNPYGTYSFPAHERLARTLLALTHGNASAQSFGWPGHRKSAQQACEEVARRAPWLTGAQPVRWGAMLVSEQTRQYVAYRDIRELFLPHVFGAFRAALEEHLPLRLVNDWDLTPAELDSYRVLVLPAAAALSDAQVAAVRGFVEAGGGLVATGETSLADEWGQSRDDFALSDLFGVAFRGRPQGPVVREALDENFARGLDLEHYFRERVGTAMLAWGEHPLTEDERLEALDPLRRVVFRGPAVLVSEPADPAEVAVRMETAGENATSSPAVIARTYGAGRVVYLAAALDAAMWSYGYGYQRRLLARAIQWAASSDHGTRIEAPMCVQATFFHREVEGRRQDVIHLFNNLNTTAGHGLPANEVPLREESVPVAGIRAVFAGQPPRRCRLEPDGRDVPLVRGDDGELVAQLPPLALHAMLVADYDA